MHADAASNAGKNSSSEERSDSGVSQSVSQRGHVQQLPAPPTRPSVSQSQRASSLAAGRTASGKDRRQMRTTFGGVGLIGRASGGVHQI